MAVTIPQLQTMKREGKRIVGIVVYDYQAAQIADRAGADVVSLGDSCGHNVLGQQSQEAVTLDEVLTLARGVRRGVKNALFSCDMPFGSYQVSEEDAVRSAVRLVKESGADCVKVEVRREQTGIVAAIARAGIPVFAQFGITPQTAAHLGGWQTASASVPTDLLVQTAVALEEAGASMLDLTRGGAATDAITKAVRIPVLGGMGTEVTCDGHMRTLFRVAGLGADEVGANRSPYGNVSQVMYDAITAYAADIRGGSLPKPPRQA